MAEELDAMRNKIIEECAKVCDAYYKEKHAAMLRHAKKERFQSADEEGDRSVGARECAAKIRALKCSSPQEEKGR
jgi:hypothetical protein